MKKKVPSQTTLRKYARKYMKILGLKKPLPIIKIVDHRIWTWLARTSSLPGRDRSIIEIQKAATIDADTLERIVAHEVIHHYEHAVAHIVTQLAKSLMPHLCDHHGARFEKLARQINKAVKRRGFITKVYDKSFITAPMSKKVWLLIIKRLNDSPLILPSLITGHEVTSQYGFCWTDRPKNKNVQKILEKLSKIPGTSGKFIETTDLNFVNGPRVEEESIAIPAGSHSKQAESRLKKLYETCSPLSMLMYFDNTKIARDKSGNNGSPLSN